jgi:hypothetical protein
MANDRLVAERQILPIVECGIQTTYVHDDLNKLLLKMFGNDPLFNRDHCIESTLYPGS